MKWRDLVVNHLEKVQGGRCQNCGAGIDLDYQKRVEYRIDPHNGGTKEIDNLKLVHIDCSVARVRDHELRAIQAIDLLRRGRSPAQVAEALGITERSIYRYQRRLGRGYAKKPTA